MGETTNILSDSQPEKSQRQQQLPHEKAFKGLTGASYLDLNAEPSDRYVWGGAHADVPKMNEDLFDGYVEQDRVKAIEKAEAEAKAQAQTDAEADKIKE